jgi:UDP-N-acetylmuramate dehydrogenase
MNKSTCGCTFKNYKTDEVTLPAGKFIDLLGLKGFSINHMRISPKHANFIENEGDSTLDDVSHLIDTIKDELYLQYGVQFEAEIKYDKR